MLDTRIEGKSGKQRMGTTGGNGEKWFSEAGKGVNLGNKRIQGEMTVIFDIWREATWKDWRDPL